MQKQAQPLDQAAELSRSGGLQMSQKRAGLAELLDSDKEIGLVIQGGGMRGVYSLSVLRELTRLGYKDRFARIWATSSGAINAAYFLAGQADDQGISAYTENLASKEFIDPLRLKRIIDIDYLVDRVLAEEVILDQQALKASASELNIALLEAETARLDWLDPRSQSWPLLETFRAAAALPIVYGKEICLGSTKYVDGALGDCLPVGPAVSAGVENLLVITTRARDHRAEIPSKYERSLYRSLARARGHSPGVIKSLGLHDRIFDRAMTDIRNGFSSLGATKIWSISPGDRIAGRLTRDRATLIKTVELGTRDTRVALLDK